MSVIVKGMAMPWSCGACKFEVLDVCLAADKAEREVSLNDRPDWCPLEEVPEQAIFPTQLSGRCSTEPVVIQSMEEMP